MFADDETMIGGGRRLAFKLILWCLILPLFVSAAADNPLREKNVLLLSSYYLAQNWTGNVVSAILSDNHLQDRKINYTFCELDTVRNPERTAWETEFAKVVPEIKQGKVDLIVALDDAAVDLVLQNHSRLPAGLPIVFAGYENYSDDLRQKYPDLTGVIQQDDTQQTLKAALTLYPAARDVVILCDHPANEMHSTKSWKTFREKHPDIRLHFLVTSPNDPQELLSRLRELPPESIVLLASRQLFYNNDLQTLLDFETELAHIFRHPGFISVDMPAGPGIIGGYQTDAKTHGKETATLIAAVLERGSAREIPPVVGSTTPQFDYALLKSERLSPSLLPANAIFRNAPVPFYEKYKAAFAVGGGVLFLLLTSTLGSSWLLRQSVRKRQELLKVFPGRFGVLDKAENILFLNTNDDAEKSLRHLRDFPQIDHEKFSGIVRQVFQTGERRMFEYAVRDVKRLVTVAPLPGRFFGRETVIWFSQDNAELQDARKRAEMLARENAENLRKLQTATHMWDLVINALPVHVFAKNADDEFRYVFSNTALQKFHRIEAQQLNGKTDAELFPKSSSGEINAIDENVMTHPNEIHEAQHLIYDPDGRMHHFHSIKRAFIDENGTRLLLGAAFDITELIQTKNDLNDMLTQHNLLLDNMPGYAFTMDIDNEFRYTSFNKSCLRLWQKTREEALGKTDSELFDPEQGKYFLAGNREAVGKESVSGQQLEFTGADGRRRIGRVFRKTLELSGGRRWLFSMVDDITEIEEAKRNAEENAEWFRLTLNSIGDAVLTTDTEGRIVLLNPVAERMLGCSREEAQGKPHEEYFHIVSAGNELPARSPVTRSLRTGTTVELANHTVLISRNGHRYHISDSAAPIKGRDNVIQGGILVFRDVSEEYENRDRLRSALARLEYGSTLTLSAPFQFDPASGKMEGTRLLAELWPLHGDTALRFQEWVQPEDLPVIEQKLDALYRHQSQQETFSFRSDWTGTLRHYRMLVNLEQKAFTPMLLTGVIQDITEITQSAGRLKEHQELWDLVINSIPIMFFAKDATDDFRYLLCNRAFADFLGKTPGEIIGKTDRELFPEKTDAEKFRCVDRGIISGSIPAYQEESVTAADGSVYSLQTIKKSFHGTNGRRLLLGASHDITELKHMIVCERVTSEILRFAVAGSEFSEVLDHIARTLQQQLGCERILLTTCRENDEFRLENEWRNNDLSPLPENALLAAGTCAAEWIHMFNANQLLKITEGGAGNFSVSKMMLPEAFSPSCIITPIFAENKLWGALSASYPTRNRQFSGMDENVMRSCAGIIALARQRERQNRVIMKANKERLLILDNIHIPIWLYDESGKIIRANRSACHLLGLTQDEIRRRPCHDVFGCHQPGSCPVELALKNHTPHLGTYHRNGREYQLAANPVLDQEGNLLNVVKTAVDVTELNSLLKNQQATNACLEILLRENTPRLAVERVLEILCTQVGASRCAVFYFDDECQSISRYAEYTASGRENIFEHIIGYPCNTTPSWAERFQSRELWAFPEAADHANGLGPDWRNCIALHDIRSLYTNRIMLDGKLWGYVAWIYESQKHELTEDDRNFISSFAHFIEFMLERKQSQEKLLASLHQAQKINQEKETLLANEKTVNYCLESLFREDDVKKAVNAVLKALRERFHATHSYILRIDRHRQLQSVFAENVQADSPPFFPNATDDFPCHISEPWLRLLLERKNMQLTDLSIPQQQELTGSWRQNVKKHGLKSIYLSGIYQNDDLWGAFGLMFAETPHTPFSDQEQALLNSAARLTEVMLVRQEARGKLIAAMEQAKNADKAKSFFIASVSHEIRTPLNSVIGFAELLRDTQVSPKEQKEYVDAIAYSGNALLQLVNDVLDLSKLESEQMVIVTETCNFSKLGGDVLKMFMHRAKEKNIELKLDLPQLPELELDKLRIRQILVNLIGNAVKFTDHGSVTLWAELKRGNAECAIFRFGVTDTGIGIPVKDISRLMEPFVQLTRLRGTNASNNGTGLGLSICKRLAEKMNGRIEIQSRPGHGSTFSVTLPQIRYHAGEAAPDHEVSTASAHATPQLAILIVDDVELNRKVLKAMCEKNGVQKIKTAPSGEDALRILEQDQFDLLLTDMWMPQMNGAELAAKVHADQRFRHLPIVAVTADAEAGEHFPQQDFTCLLLKPVTREKVGNIIRQAINTPQK